MREEKTEDARQTATKDVDKAYINEHGRKKAPALEEEKKMYGKLEDDPPNTDAAEKTKKKTKKGRLPKSRLLVADCGFLEEAL